jgi:hypothetical protein
MKSNGIGKGVFYYQNSQRTDARLINKQQKLCSPIGDYTMPTMRHQQPARGSGSIDLFRRNGMQVWRLDEFRTSRYCPKCLDPALPFLWGRNPRPHQLQKRPMILCHGLLRCSTCDRKWNCDLLAVLNYRFIVNALANGLPGTSPFERA